MTKPNTDLYLEQNARTDFDQRVRLNQQKLTSDLKSHYDFIVCGGGTSGCVVAARLASDLNTQVLLLEAGGTDEKDSVMNPNHWPMTLGTELDWGFIAEPNPNLNGRAIGYSMGKVLGGGSSINVSTWSRGHRADLRGCDAELGVGAGDAYVTRHRELESTGEAVAVDRRDHRLQQRFDR